jgi:hypothetical protein
VRAFITNVPTPAAAQGGGWWDLVAIYRESDAEIRAERASDPVACPNDGEPLRAGPDGRLFCPYDGWRPA